MSSFTNYSFFICIQFFCVYLILVQLLPFDAKYSIEFFFCQFRVEPCMVLSGLFWSYFKLDLNLQIWAGWVKLAPLVALNLLTLRVAQLYRLHVLNFFLPGINCRFMDYIIILCFFGKGTSDNSVNKLVSIT